MGPPRERLPGLTRDCVATGVQHEAPADRVPLPSGPREPRHRPGPSPALAVLQAREGAAGTRPRPPASWPRAAPRLPSVERGSTRVSRKLWKHCFALSGQSAPRTLLVGQRGFGWASGGQGKPARPPPPGLGGERGARREGCSRSGRSPQILTCLLTERRVVLFSSSWALLPLVAECFLAYLHPLQWQHTFAPILSRHMLDFVMAPTSFLMGCHLDHFQEVSKVRPPPSPGRPRGDPQRSGSAPRGGGWGWRAPRTGCALGTAHALCCHASAPSPGDLRVRSRPWCPGCWDLVSLWGTYTPGAPGLPAGPARRVRAPSWPWPPSSVVTSGELPAFLCLSFLTSEVATSSRAGRRARTVPSLAHDWAPRTAAPSAAATWLQLFVNAVDTLARRHPYVRCGVCGVCGHAGPAASADHSLAVPDPWPSVRPFCGLVTNDAVCTGLVVRARVKGGHRKGLGIQQGLNNVHQVSWPHGFGMSVVIPSASRTTSVS